VIGNFAADGIRLFIIAEDKTASMEINDDWQRFGGVRNKNTHRQHISVESNNL